MHRLLLALRLAVPVGALALLAALPVRAQGNCSDGSTGVRIGVSRTSISPDGNTFEICYTVQGDPSETVGDLSIGFGKEGPACPRTITLAPGSPFEEERYSTELHTCLLECPPCGSMQLLDTNGSGPHEPLPSEPTAFICVQYEILDPAGTLFIDTGGYDPVVSGTQPDGSELTVCPAEDHEDYTGPLPVELASFEAVADGRDVVLRWTTASETNNAGFEVEHRAPDAPFFEPVTFVEGHGTTAEAQAYRHRADGLWPGTHTFRLKQVDFDGAVDYSHEVEAEVDVPGAALAQVYPSPANPQATFTFIVGEDQFIVAEVFDMRGRRVAQPFRQTAVAQQTYTLASGAGLPSGVYVLRLLGDRMERPLTARFVIAR